MSIENNLKRIADALEGIFECQLAMISTPDASSERVPVQKAAVLDQAPTALSSTVKDATPSEAPATVSTETPPPPPPADAPTTLTRDVLNGVLVEEFNRLGSREGIDKVIQGEPFNATGIDGIDPSMYQELINAVREL